MRVLRDEVQCRVDRGQLLVHVGQWLYEPPGDHRDWDVEIPTHDGMVTKATPPLGPRGRATSTGNASHVDLNASAPIFFDQTELAVFRC